MPKVVDKMLRRKEILDAAANVFATLGYNQTRVVDIATEAGISKGLVYDYFKSKEEIFLEVCRCIVPWQTLSDADFEPSISSIERLICNIEASYDMAKDFFIIMSEFWSIAMHGPAEQKKAMISQGSAFYEVPRGLITDFIKKGQKQKVFNSEADPALLANMIIASIEGIRMQNILDSKNARKMETLNLLIDTVQRKLVPAGTDTYYSDPSREKKITTSNI